MTETPQGSNRTQPSLGALMSRVSENISTLIRTEIALNKAKAAETGKRFGLGAGLLGAAAVFALFGLGYLLTTLSQVIALWLPQWAGSLIVAVLVLIVAGVLALVGKKEIDKGRVVVPTPQVGLRQDVQAVTNSLREGLATDDAAKPATAPAASTGATPRTAPAAPVSNGPAASGPTGTAPAGPAFGQN